MLSQPEPEPLALLCRHFINSLLSSQLNVQNSYSLHVLTQVVQILPKYVVHNLTEVSCSCVFCCVDRFLPLVTAVPSTP